MAGSEESPGVAALRRLILLLYLLGVVGATAELLLLEHFESAIQIAPFAGLAVATAALLVAVARPRPTTLRAARVALILLAIVGALGLYFHYAGNVEFEREAHPDRTGLRLWWEAMRGATPALAPGLLAQIGLIGLAYTFRHPALGRAPSNTEDAT